MSSRADLSHTAFLSLLVWVTIRADPVGAPSKAARLLRLWVRILPRALMFVR